MNCIRHVALVLSAAAASGGFLSDFNQTTRIRQFFRSRSCNFNLTRLPLFFFSSTQLKNHSHFTFLARLGLRLQRRICRAAFVAELQSRFWYLFHSCECLSRPTWHVFVVFFFLYRNSIALNFKLNTWIKHQPPQTPRVKPFSLLYLSGRQLVAALALGSLRVAVNQHPLQLELQDRRRRSVHRSWRSFCVPCENVCSPPPPSVADQSLWEPHWFCRRRGCRRKRFLVQGWQ